MIAGLASFTHTPINSTGTVGSDDFGGFNSAQYGWSHPHHHHSSTDMIADYGDNSNSTGGSENRGGFSSAQYGGVQPHHHHSSTDMIADFNGDNSNSDLLAVITVGASALHSTDHLAVTLTITKTALLIQVGCGLHIIVHQILLISVEISNIQGMHCHYFL